MSGSSFHVHGPHDHELEHATQHAAKGGGERLTNQIAIFTAIVATVGALFSYMAGATQANAGLYKNNAAIKKTEAANQWNFYQAKSTKQALVEVTRELAPPERRPSFDARIQRYDAEKSEIKAQAEKLEAQAHQWDRRSDQQLHAHHRWAQATTVLQVSIALAAIVLLTRRKPLEWLMFGSGVLGVGLGIAAFLHW